MFFCSSSSKTKDFITYKIKNTIKKPFRMTQSFETNSDLLISQA